jgi:hypothetical protein
MLTIKVWLTPTGLGLKLMCATGVIVTLGVAPDGNGPLTGTSVCALTGTVNIAIVEAIKRTIKNNVAVFVLLIEICIFFSLNFY